MAKYDYSDNPYNKETQRKEWTEWRAETRATQDLQSGRVASMLTISDAISNFNIQRNLRKEGKSL